MPRKGEKQDPEVQEKIRAKLIERWKDPERHARQSAKMQGRVVSQETREKLRKASTGKKLGDEHLAAMSKAAKKLWQSEEYRTNVLTSLNDPTVKTKVRVPNDKKRSAKMAYWARLDPAKKVEILANWHVSGTAHAKPTDIEIKMQEALDKAGIDYVFHFIAKPYVIDFYLPAFHACLECDDEYWHERTIDHDHKRDQKLLAQGYKVIRISGRSTRKNADEALRTALKQLEE